MEAAIRRLARSGAVGLGTGAGLALLQGAPVVIGLAYLLLPAFGHFPVLGATGFGLDAWREALGEPGLGRSLAAMLCAGISASLVSLGFSLAIVSRIAPRGELVGPSAKSVRTLLQAVVATPPVALAVGLAFVVAPSGWLARLAQVFIGWDRPPEWLFPHDPWGFALALALVLKETPFLTLAALVALKQMNPRQIMDSAMGLGYAPSAAWAKLLLPELLYRLRWPMFAVLAYALSCVDLAILLGPSVPATLSVVIADMGRDPELRRRLPAAALAVLQVGLVLGSWLFFVAAARLANRLVLHPWRIGGSREIPKFARLCLRRATDVLSAIAGATVAASFLSLPLWSFALAWRYPEILPQCCSLANWRRAGEGAALPLWNALGLGLGASILAFLASVFFLSAEARWNGRSRSLAWAGVFLPLLAPDIGFLLGMQIFFLTLGWRSGIGPVLWAHFLFVFPYVLLTMADSWRRLDPRYERAAACLGASPLHRLVWVRLALLRPVVVLALALGVAVSLSLYLPTVLLGGGRVATLATEAVALSSGGDRRILGVYALAQTVLAWSFLALAGALATRRFEPERKA